MAVRTGAAGKRGTRRSRHTTCVSERCDVQPRAPNSLQRRPDIAPLYRARDLVQAATGTSPTFVDAHPRLLLESIHRLPQPLPRNRVQHGPVEGFGCLSLREQRRLRVRITYRREVRGEMLRFSRAIVPKGRWVGGWVGGR